MLLLSACCARKSIAASIAHPLVVTDGVRRRDLASQVKPFGKVEFIANTAIADAVRWALTELQKRSPVLTGRYASSHTVMIKWRRGDQEYLGGAAQR